MLNYIIENYLPLIQGTLLGTILGFLIGQLIQHYLSKVRDKENFKRQTMHEENKEIEVTLNQLGSFMNGILRCWEEASFNASHAQTLNENQFQSMYRSVSFDEFGDCKKELVSKGVFPPKAWHSFDELPEQIDRANEVAGTFHMAPAVLAHFANFCESLWSISAESYVSRGGDLNNLTKPMPAKYERYGG